MLNIQYDCLFCRLLPVLEKRGSASEIDWIGRQVIDGWKILIQLPQPGQYGQQGLRWNTYLLRFNLEGLRTSFGDNSTTPPLRQT